MENFERADAIIADIEGGHANQAGDSGGDTWYGVARNYHPNETPWPPSVERARELRQMDYWNACGCVDMPWQAAMVTYDMAILSGPRSALLMLQSIIGVKVDGHFGPVSQKALLAYIASHPYGQVVVEMQTAREMHYMDLPLWKEDGRGWTRRLFRVATAAGKE